MRARVARLEPLALEVRVWTRDNVSMEGSVGVGGY